MICKNDKKKTVNDREHEQCRSEKKCFLCENMLLNNSISMSFVRMLICNKRRLSIKLYCLNIARN